MTVFTHSHTCLPYGTVYTHLYTGVTNTTVWARIGAGNVSTPVGVITSVKPSSLGVGDVRTFTYSYDGIIHTDSFVSDS